MPIHFAGSRRPATSVLARSFSRPSWVFAHNDNGVQDSDDAAANAAQVDSPLLRAALEHFAAHGLAAAGTALDLAEAAGAAGDTAGQHHWTAVGRMLDRRLAQRRRGGKQSR